MNRTKKWAIALTGGALALIVAAGATSSFAQEPTTPTPRSQVAPDGAPGRNGFGRGFGFHGLRGGDDRYDELLADELGITVERLNEARQAAYSRALDQAVADGDLTQEQADLLEARQALETYIDEEAILAGALGMTVRELQDARAAGQRLDEIIEAQGLDPATVRDAMQQGYEDAVQQAVAGGVITQAQADQFLAGDGFPGFGRGRRFHFHGPRGGGFRGAPDTTTPDSSDSSA